jgi:hypothetical protein
VAKKDIISDFHDPKDPRLTPAPHDAAKQDPDSEAKEDDSSQETPKPESSGNSDDE